MAIWTGLRQTDAVRSAANDWKQRCMLSNGSVLSDKSLWTKDNVDTLKKLFVDNPILGGDRSFYDKLQEQIGAAAPAVKQLAAEFFWLLFLFVYEGAFSVEKKRERISEVWAQSGEELPASPLLADDVLRGLATPGTAFLTKMWEELGYVLQLISIWKALPAPRQEALLQNNPWELCQWATTLEGGDVRAFRHMFLYFCYPEDFERICSRGHKRKIYARFSGKLEGRNDPYLSDRTPCGLDKAILEIRRAFESELGKSELDFYVSPLREKWIEAKPPKGHPELATEASAQRRYWIEKTIVHGRPDRVDGPHRLGEALWSPQKSADGRNIYSNMRQVAIDDVVLHLTDKANISGVSLVQSPADSTFVGVKGTAWADQPSFRIQLKDYALLDPPLPRSAFLDDPALADELRIILKAQSGRGLFFNKDFDLNQGAYLTEAPPELISVLNRIYKRIAAKGLPYVEDTPEVAPAAPDAAPFTLEDAAEGLFLDVERIERILTIWAAKKNLILQGPPGVGKTFAARRLAYALMGRASKARLGFVQFHQSYSYEDFIQGYRPDGNGFSLKNGVFYEFCQKAAAAPGDQRHVFVIDEINRGNISRIFGELLLLIEADKRGKEWEMPLVYSGNSKFFHIPANVYLLGLMNTADRSLAVIDYALRRRFAFEELKPEFDSKKFEAHLKANQVSDRLISLIRQRLDAVNEAISQDTTNLGRGFCIGHSFFCQPRAAGQSEMDWYRGVIETEVVPLLTEYWFDIPSRIEDWQRRLLEAS